MSGNCRRPGKRGCDRDPSLCSGYELNRLLQRRGWVEAFDFYAGDAVAFHLEDGVAAVVVFETFAALRNFAQLRHHEAGQSLKTFFTRQSDVILGFKVAQVEAAIEHYGTGGEREARSEEHTSE